jgi:hypothetical protein
LSIFTTAIKIRAPGGPYMAAERQYKMKNLNCQELPELRANFAITLSYQYAEDLQPLVSGILACL